MKTTFNTKVKKWGNSLAIRIPKKLADQYNLSQNTEINLKPDKNEIKLQLLENKNVNRKNWKKYFIPMNKPAENVSDNIDEIVYGASR
jgi:antitoxin component of MazEF toxin-antitoxin module